MRCGHDGQHIFAIAPQHDALGETIARDVACLSRASGRHGKFVRDLLVLDVFSGQISLECGSNGHDVTSGAIRKPSTVKSSCRLSLHDGRLRNYKANIDLPSASYNSSSVTRVRCITSTLALGILPVFASAGDLRGI